MTTIHGAFANFEGSENVVNEDKIWEYEQLAQRKLSLATFSANWFKQIQFPMAKAIRLKKAGITPVIRIMPRSDFTEGRPDPVYSMQKIATGVFDNQLIEWARDCALFNSEVIVDFAVEANGTWFPWSSEDPKHYISAFRRVQTIIKSIASKTEYIWHVNADESRDNLARYYPGHDFVDYVGASIYGNWKPNEKPKDFAGVAKVTFGHLEHITPKPKAISEIGVTEAGEGVKAKWIADAFDYITNNGSFAFVSWWHSRFKSKDNDYVNYRVDSTPEALAAYRKAVRNPIFR